MLGVPPSGCDSCTARQCNAVRGSLVHREVVLVLRRLAGKDVHFHARVIDAEDAVVIGRNERITPLGIGRSMARTVKPHHSSTVKGVSGLVGHNTCNAILGNDRNEIVTHLAFNDLYGIGRNRLGQSRCKDSDKC